MYFKEYHKHKVFGQYNGQLCKRAYDSVVPKTYRTRDAVIAELQSQSDVALLVVDAMVLNICHYYFHWQNVVV
jgi:hypothetical protein